MLSKVKGLWHQIRDTTRPNTLPPASPEIIKEPDQYPSDAYEATIHHVNYGVQPWIFTTYTMSIPEVVELIPNNQQVPWTEMPGINENG
jgi:hypothetical protein